MVFRSDIDRKDGPGKKLLIKRVIGVEGDVITIKAGKVYRNGDVLDEPYVNEQQTQDDDIDVDSETIGENQIFVMGDNRDVSIDSRSKQVGQVNEEQLVGRAIIRLYPFNQITKL